jgi:hypothetical protein
VVVRRGGGGAVSIVSGRRAVGGARGGGVRGVDGRWSSTTRRRRNRGRVNTSMGRTVKKKDTEKGVARARTTQFKDMSSMAAVSRWSCQDTLATTYPAIAT